MTEEHELPSDHDDLPEADFTFPLRGARFRGLNEQHALLSAFVGDEVLLVAEPTNPYDPDAIKVMLNGHHIGYVPRESTSRIPLESSFAAKFVNMNGHFSEIGIYLIDEELVEDEPLDEDFNEEDGA